MNDIEECMKKIEVDDDIYRHIASQTQQIGESASDILRRLLGVTGVYRKDVQLPQNKPETTLVENILVDGRLEQETKAISRFMLILKTLYESDPKKFCQAADATRGRKRVYFSQNLQELTTHGNTTKPKAVQGTPYWVISNTNTLRKKLIVEQLMQAMEYPQTLIKKIIRCI